VCLDTIAGYGELIPRITHEPVLVVKPEAVSRFNKALPREDQASPAVIAKSRQLLKGISVLHGHIDDGLNPDNHTHQERMARLGFIRTLEEVHFEPTSGEVSYSTETRLRAEKIAHVLDAVRSGLESYDERFGFALVGSAKQTRVKPYDFGQASLDYMQMFYDRGLTAS
jgi:hypothetical protein